MKLRSHFFAVIALFIIWGCSKSNNNTSSPSVVDYATPACGTYKSTNSYTPSDTVVITKQSDTVVWIKCNFPHEFQYNFPYVNVESGNGNIHLYLDGRIDGYVTGKVLHLHIVNNTFEGIKP